MKIDWSTLYDLHLTDADILQLATGQKEVKDAELLPRDSDHSSGHADHVGTDA